jgi:hypothetical protein
MKKILIILPLIVLVFGCTKKSACSGCDVIMVDPGDVGGGGSGSGNICYYTGSSNCDVGNFTVTHDNIFRYSLSYNINSGAMTISSFTTGFTIASPTTTKGTLMAKYASYNRSTHEVIVTTSWQIETRSWNGTNADGTPKYVYDYTTTSATDIIKTCDNVVILQ